MRVGTAGPQATASLQVPLVCATLLLCPMGTLGSRPSLESITDYGAVALQADDRLAGRVAEAGGEVAVGTDEATLGTGFNPYVPHVVGAMYDAFSRGAGRGSGPLAHATRGYKKLVKLKDVRNLVPGDASAEKGACRVDAHGDANTHLAWLFNGLGLPRSSTDFLHGINFEKAIVRGSKSGNYIFHNKKHGIFLKEMRPAEIKLMDEFAGDYVNHFREPSPAIKAAGCKYVESSMMMKILLIFGVQCKTASSSRYWEWSYWHLITDINLYPKPTIMQFDIKASRKLQDCHEADFYSGDDTRQGYIGDFQESIWPCIQRASCVEKDYRDKLPCFMTMLQHDLAVLDSRHFIDYSLLVQVQDFDPVVDMQAGNMLRVNYRGRDAHVVVGLIDLIGEKTALRGMQSVFEVSWWRRKLFNQNKFQGYPFYLACAATYLFDSQSCPVGLENPRCHSSILALSSGEVERKASSTVASAQEVPFFEKGRSKYARRMTEADGCDVALSCKALIFSRPVRDNFKSCRMAAGGAGVRRVAFHVTDCSEEGAVGDWLHGGLEDGHPVYVRGNDETLRFRLHKDSGRWELLRDSDVLFWSDVTTLDIPVKGWMPEGGPNIKFQGTCCNTLHTKTNATYSSVRRKTEPNASEDLHGPGAGLVERPEMKRLRRPRQFRLGTKGDTKRRDVYVFVVNVEGDWVLCWVEKHTMEIQRQFRTECAHADPRIRLKHIAVVRMQAWRLQTSEGTEAVVESHDPLHEASEDLEIRGERDVVGQWTMDLKAVIGLAERGDWQAEQRWRGARAAAPPRATLAVALLTCLGSLLTSLERHPATRRQRGR